MSTSQHSNASYPSAQSAIDALRDAATPELRQWMARRQGDLSRIVGGVISYQTAPSFSGTATASSPTSQVMTLPELLGELKKALVNESDAYDKVVKAYALGADHNKNTLLSDAFTGYMSTIADILAVCNAIVDCFDALHSTLRKGLLLLGLIQEYQKWYNIVSGLSRYKYEIKSDIDAMNKLVQDAKLRPYRVLDWMRLKSPYGWALAPSITSTRATMKSTAKTMASISDWCEEYKKTKLATSYPGPPINGFVLINERARIEGFQCAIIGFDETNPKHVSALALTKAVLAKYRQQAKRYLPELLGPMLLPIELFFIDVPFLGAYTGWGDHIKLAPLGFDNSLEVNKVDVMVKAIAHEMGHHYYRQRFSKSDIEAWTALVDATMPLDINKVLEAWERVSSARQSAYFLWSYVLDELDKTDPVTALQIRIECTDYAQYGECRHTYDKLCSMSLKELKSLAKKAPMVRMHPVSIYGATNPSEAFSETIGHAVAYGPQSVPPVLLDLAMRFIPKMKRNPRAKVTAS
jgi:hypothetical protein